MKIRINNIEKPEGKSYFKISFEPLVEGHKSASVWEDKILEGVNIGDEAEIEYKIKDKFMNITQIKVTEKEKPMDKKAIMELYKECKDYVKTVYSDNQNLDITSSVNTLFITLMRR